MDEALFWQSQITVHWHSYVHPIYKQRFEGFEPNMSVIDLLFNMGPDAKEIILKGGSVKQNKSSMAESLTIKRITEVEKPLV